MDGEVVSGIIGSGPSGCLSLNSFHVSSQLGARPEDTKIPQAFTNMPSWDNKTAKSMTFREIESSEWERSKGPVALRLFAIFHKVTWSPLHHRCIASQLGLGYYAYHLVVLRARGTLVALKTSAKSPKSYREALLSKKTTTLGQKQDGISWEYDIKVRQDSWQTSSKDGNTIFVLCKDSEWDGIGAEGAAKRAIHVHLRECEASWDIDTSARTHKSTSLVPVTIL